MMKTCCLFLLLLIGIAPASVHAQITAESSQKQIPVLIRKDDNEVLCVKITCPDKTTATLRSLTFTTQGTTDIRDIESIALYSTGAEKNFATKSRVGSTLSAAKEFTVRQQVKLSEGDNYFWLSAKLKPSADLFHKIDFQCTKVEADNNTLTPKDTTPDVVKRIGIAVRNRGDDGSHTYRIPGLVYTTKKTLIGVYDIRWKNAADLQGDIDVGVSRSTDGGQTWLPMKKAIDMKKWGNKPENQNGVGDPAVLVDTVTGRIWVAGLWSHGNPGMTWHSSKPGMKPEETSQFLLAYSDDEGASWSKPINITEQIKDPKWQLLLQGPGMGICLKDGTLVFPAQFKDENKVPHSTIIYSKDRGKTWAIGTGAKSKTTEAQVVELQNGDLMLNMRDDRGGSRSVSVTSDLGKTWQEHSTSRSALQEPVCMASIIRMKLQDGRNVLVFCNPNTKRGRTHLTLKFSLDDGQTWPEKYNFLLYSEGCYGYSCLAPMDNDIVSVLYEGAGDLYFEKVNVAEVLGR
ncbi:MAG: exo-alpha-sialidase [Puniceicoccales bacterium]|jgi:sialidase-1|nr:exo-alpha-sialidase [Puniceicoccales bacterium]